jgi:hypothetical protein
MSLESMSKKELITIIKEFKEEMLEAKKLKQAAEGNEDLLTHTAVAIYVDKNHNHEYIELRYNPLGTEAKVVKRVNKGTASHMARLELEKNLGDSIISQLRQN